MYARHRAAVVVVFVLVTGLSYFSDVSYGDLADTAVTVVSILVAVYIAAMSALLGSPYATQLKAVADGKIRGKSQLGVLTVYLRIAGACGTATIIISCLYQVPVCITIPSFVAIVSSSISCGIFAVNILFLWIIFQFLATALINSTQRLP